MEKKTDLRILKTYRALFDAFTELLDEKRFEEITVGELCDRAMIRRTTFYKHFADKNEYFTYYVKEIRDKLQSKLPPQMKEDSPKEYLALMSRTLYRFMRSHQQLISNITNSNMVDVLFNLLYEMVVKDLMNSMNNSEYSDEERGLIASFFAGGLLCTLRWWITSHENVTEDQFIEATGKLVGTSFSDIRLG